MAVLSNDKRWLVILAASNKVLAPVLRDIVKQGMDNLYEFLDNHLNGLLTPCSLKTLTNADVCHLATTPSPASALKDLNFGNINNNCDLHGKTKAAYDYTVNSSVDLAKLYLPNYLAKLSAFDKSMDLSAALRLLGHRKYPTQIFVSSDPLHNIQSLADDVRDNVRNPASHFDEGHWTQIVFDQCFDKIKALVQCLPLNAAKKKEPLDQLSEWKTKGFQLILDEDVKDLMLQFQNDIPTRDEIEKIIEKYSSLNRTFLSAKFDVVLSVLQEIQASTLNQESSNSVHPSGSSVSPTEATSKSKDIQSSKMKGKDPDSNCELRAETAKLSRGTLHKAAINGRCDVIKVLLESGEDVDQTDKFNLTPLHLAAWYGQRAVVKLLLHHGANVNAVDRFQKTALQKAYRNSHRTIVELLLRNNASPSYNQPPSLKSLSEKAFLHVDERSGFNRLHAAVFHGDYDTFWKTHAYLDNYVQDMSFQKTGSQAKAFPAKTALEILLAQQEKGEGNVGIEKLYKEIIETIDTLTEPHLCKCTNDAEKAVEIVLNDGVDINIPGKSNRTPLLWASLSASGKFMQTLMDLGADVNTQRTDDKIAPLKLATSWNNYMATNILLRHGADVNIQDRDGWTSLHSCASRGLLSISQLLIDSRCNINLRSNQGLTSLYLAVRSKNKHLVKCLLEKKADVNVKYEENVNDRLFLVRGKDRGKAAWLYVLVKRTVFPLFLRRTQGGSLNVANFGQVLKSGWGNDLPESVRIEFSEKAKTFPDIHSLTVLHVASKSSSPEIVELLVKYNADIKGCDGDGFTPLHLAAMHGNFCVVKKLVELNADVNLKVDGKDAADLAHMNEETGIEEFLRSKRSLPLNDSDV